MYGEKTLTLTLTYLGAAPFMAAALATLLGIGGAFPAQAFLAYGGVISAFMAGTAWMQGQAFSVQPKQLLLLSNAAALVAFSALISPAPLKLSLAMQAIAFIALLYCDHLVAAQGKQPGWYFSMRRNVTMIVLATYLVMFVGA